LPIFLQSQLFTIAVMFRAFENCPTTIANVSKEKYTGGIRQISGSGMVNSVQMSAVERLLVYGDQGSGARMFYLFIETDAFENAV
jgi:hypothetical protein